MLDDGRIAARGTHDELLATSPVYRDIYEHGLLERQFADAVEARADADALEAASDAPLWYEIGADARAFPIRRPRVAGRPPLRWARARTGGSP